MSLMVILVTNTEVHTTPIHIKEEGETTQHDVTTLTTAVTQHLTLDSGSDFDFSDALVSTGMWHKIMVSEKTATIKPTVKPDSDSGSNSDITFS